MRHSASWPPELARYLVARFDSTGVVMAPALALVHLAEAHPHFVQYFADPSLRIWVRDRLL